MTPSGTLTGLGARAGYPQLVVPAGYNASNRLPVGIAFNGTAFSEANLLAFGYAYEQATHLREPPSQTNPSLWRCVPGNAYTVTTSACAPGVAHDYGAQTTATVISTAGDATLTVSDPSPVATGHLVNGAFARPAPLKVAGAELPAAVRSYAAPVSNEVVPVRFTQSIGPNDPLRTGTYAKTLTFTSSTTSP
jgi:hypothetical protein